MQYVHSLPEIASYKAKGFVGYELGPLKRNDTEVHYIDVITGHDTFQVSKKITRVYYILSGSGYFTIENRQYPVAPGSLVEVPPKVEYSYSGTMAMIAFCRPRWVRGNDRSTKWNADVVGTDAPVETAKRSFLGRLAKVRFLGKSPLSGYLKVNKRLWSRLPSKVAGNPLVRQYGEWLHKLARLTSNRAQAFATFFLRNRPQLELIRRIVLQERTGAVLRLTVLGCSSGAEAYSIAWTIRSARPDLKLILNAVDISEEAVEFARTGDYDYPASRFTGTDVLERISSSEIDQIFDRDECGMTVKAWIRTGIEWQVGDAGDPALSERIGPQDIVVANNFLCHMEPATAGKCLRNAAELVKPSGHLFVSGIDLAVRTEVAMEMRWTPIPELIRETHEGDSALRAGWPSEYWGLEPFNNKRHDWRIRYASAFQIGEAPLSIAVDAADTDRVFQMKEGD